MTKPGPLCYKCPLLNAPGPVWGEGSSNAKLVIIGQCPGPEEIRAGRPFVGGSGNILERSLARAGGTRYNSFVTNTVKCFVQPKTPVPRGAAECCRPLLDKELDSLERRIVILTLGQEAFYEFSGKKMLTVSPPRSIKKPPNSDHWLRGAVYPLGVSTCIVPAAHPAYVASTGFRDSTFFDADVAKAFRISKLGFHPIKETYDYNPNTSQVSEVVNAAIAQRDFALDFETPEKSAAEEEEELLGSGPTEIQVAGISVQSGHCLGVPGDMLSLIRPLFTHKHPAPVTCRIFNWGFEGYHLQKQFGGLSVIPIDLMLQLNRCYSDSKRKDLGTALSLFSDMPYTKNLSKSDPNRYNACDTYGTLVASRNAQLFQEALGIWDAFLECDVPLWQAVIDMKVLGTRCDVDHAQRLEFMMYKALSAYESWWGKSLPLIDWQSPKQLLAMFAAMHLPIIEIQRVKKDKSGNKIRYSSPSCDESVLEIYRDKHQSQVAGLLLTMRGLKKASDFTRIYKADGSAHPTHKIHGQVAGRIQAKDPDLQNIPEELANIHPRQIIIPDDPDSECIISADFEAIEFYIYGHVSKDESINRARREGTYIYGVFYKDLFHEDFFLPGCPPKKPYRRKDIPPWKLLVAKSGPLGIIYGRGPASLETGFGIAKSVANKMYNDFAAEHPAVFAHHKVRLEDAARDGLLRNCFNRIRWFPNVKGMRNEILAFDGQSNAADILIRNAILPLHAGMGRYGGRLLFPVHDSVQVTCKRSSLYSAVSFVQDCMEAPLPQMQNFFPTISLKVSTRETSTTGKPNWHDSMAWEDWVLTYGDNYRATRDVQKLPAGQVAKP